MDPGQQYHLNLVSSTNSRKFNTRAERYQINVNPMPPQTDLAQAVAYLRDILDHILQNILTYVDPRDFVRLVITSPDGLLQTPISIPFLRCDNLTVDRIMDYIEKIVQSAFRWLLEGRFNVTLYHVKMPRGGSYRIQGRGKRGITAVHEYLKTKKSVVTIENKYDKLCMARAIAISLTAELFGRNSPQYLK